MASMGQEADTPVKGATARPRRRWLWALIAWLLIAALIGGYFELTRRSRAALAEARARFNDLPLELRDKLDELGPATLAQVQAMLGHEVRPELITSGSRRGYSVAAVDLSSGHRVVLVFDFAGQLYSFRIFTRPERAPQPNRALRILEAAHPQILTWTLPVWAVLLTLVVMARPLRRAAAQAALALALLSLTAAVLQYGGTGRYIGLADHFVFVPLYATQAALAVVSVIVVALTLMRRRDPNDLRCPRCHYDLHANQSGVCPECGGHIPASLRWKIRTLSGGAVGVAPVTESPFTVSDDAADDEGEDTLPA
jgi:hypothetical protein